MTEIVASSLINIVKFKVDMSSYRRAIKAIENVKAKLKSLNSNINSNPHLGGDTTPRGARQRINRVRDDARNFADAHVRQRRRVSAEVARAEEAAYREARAREVRRRNQALSAQNVANRRSATTDLYSQRFDFAASRSTRLPTGQISQYRQQVASLNAQFRAGNITGQQYREGIRQIGVTMRAANREALTMRERITGMRSEILLFGLTAGAAFKSITDIGSKFENTGIMMKTVFGEDAGKEMQYLREQTDRLGISLIDSVKTYAQLVFQAKEMGTSQQEMKDVWVGLGETSKVFGMDQQALAGSFKAIIQMYS